MFTDVVLTLALLFVDVVLPWSLQRSSSVQQIYFEKNSNCCFSLQSPNSWWLTLGLHLDVKPLVFPDRQSKCCCKKTHSAFWSMETECITIWCKSIKESFKHPKRLEFILQMIVFTGTPAFWYHFQMNVPTDRLRGVTLQIVMQSVNDFRPSSHFHFSFPFLISISSYFNLFQSFLFFGFLESFLIRPSSKSNIKNTVIKNSPNCLLDIEQYIYIYKHIYI